MITVPFMNDDDNLTFCISNHEVGIDKKHFEKIFLIFQRLDTGEGSGI